MKRLNAFSALKVTKIIKTTAALRRHFPRITSILLLMTCAAILDASAQSEVIKINYDKLVDRAPYTHSGQSVGEVLTTLKQIQVPPAVFSNPVYDQGRVVLEKAMFAPVMVDLPTFDIDRAIETHERDVAAYNRMPVPIIKRFLETRGRELSLINSARNVSALVEPFLEPYAFLLQDALETENPTLLKNSLTEVGDLFPAGEKQPAWANLVKTRHYYVLSDGKGYVRLFLPGRLSIIARENISASEAYQKHYGAVRHILNWLRESSQNKELNVDVYAYSNDLRNQILTLGKTPHSFKVTETLAPPAGTIPLDLKSIEDFLAKKLTLEGAYINDEGTLVLYGSKSAAPPTLEGQPMELSDFAAAYRAIFYAGYNEPYISLDSSPFPEQVNVNFGGRLADTRIGWVTLRSDMRFKTLGTGIDYVSREDYSDKIKEKMPDFQSLIERVMLSQNMGASSYEQTRFWFYPERDKTDTIGGVEALISRDQKYLRISSPRFIGKAERQSASNGETQLTNTTPPWTRNTLLHLNRNYNSFATMFPELRELDDVGRLLSLFNWLKEKQSKGLKLDLDALLNVELAECETPDRMPQLLAGFQNDGNKIKPINLTFLTESIAAKRVSGDNRILMPGGRALEQKDLLILAQYAAAEKTGNKQVKTLSAIGGGIDLSLRKTLSRARRLPNAGELIYTRIKQSAPEVGALETPSKRLFRANVKTVGEIRSTQNTLSKPQPKQHQTGETKVITTGVESKFIANAKREVVEYKPANEKVEWTRNAPENSFAKQNSKTVFFGGDGKPENFIRTEDNSRIVYKIGKNGDNFVAEKTALSKENEVSLINGLSKKGDSDLQIWRSLSENTDIKAFERMSDGSMAVLRETPEKGFRLTLHDAENNVLKTFEGREAIAEMDKATRLKLEAASTDEVAFVHAAIEDGNFIFQVGTERKQFSSAEISEALQNPASKSAREFDALFNRQGDFIIYRDAFSRLPERLGKSVRGETIADPIVMMARLRERFPEKKIFLDDEVDVAKENIKAIESMKKPGDVGLLAPEDSFPVKDHGLVKNVKKNWAAAGGIVLENVLQQPEAMRRIPNVLLFSGHNDANLTSYLAALGEQGLLKGKVVFLNTCFANENPHFNNHLIKKYQPKAVFIHSEKISPDAMELVIDNFSNLLKNAEASGKPIHPLELMEESIKLSLADEDATPTNIEEIKKLRRGTFQVSWMRKTEQSKQAE